jgi:ribosome-associated protein
MIFASGSSDRHVKSLAGNVEDKVREAGIRPLGVEGNDQTQANWVLVDLGDIVVHVMLPETREYYQLEKLWADAQAAA